MSAYYQKRVRGRNGLPLGRLTKNVTMLVAASVGDALPGLPLHSGNADVHVQIGFAKMMMFDPLAAAKCSPDPSSKFTGKWHRDGRRYDAVPTASADMPCRVALEHAIQPNDWMVIDRFDESTSLVTDKSPMRGFLRLRLADVDDAWHDDWGVILSITQRPGG